MTRLVRIGNTVVRVEGAEALSRELRGLCRADAPGADPRVTLSVEARGAVDWPLDVSRSGDAHVFGRPRYALEVLPAARQLRLLLCDGIEFNDLYWLQRDIFGVLACLSGDLMLHASAVRGPDGRGHVFCGASGAGKSTLARLLQQEGLCVVNDEVNWISGLEQGALALVNQPFWFNDDDAESLPLGGIYLLRQGAGCAFREAPAKAEIFAALLSAHLSIDIELDFLQARAHTLARLLEHYPVKVLEFNLDTKALAELLWTSPSLRHA